MSKTDKQQLVYQAEDLLERLRMDYLRSQMRHADALEHQKAALEQSESAYHKFQVQKDILKGIKEL